MLRGEDDGEEFFFLCPVCPGDARLTVISDMTQALGTYALTVSCPQCAYTGATTLSYLPWFPAGEPENA